MGLSIVLIVFQYITLQKFQVLSPIVYFNLPGLLQLILTSAPLDFIDLILALLILSLFSTLCLLEYRRKRFSQFLIQTFASNTRTRIVLALGSLVLVRFYFAPSAFHWMSDMASHISYAWLAANTFQQGEFPIWTNYLGTGGPTSNSTDFCSFIWSVWWI